MVIKTTNHFLEKCEERYETRTSNWMIETFKYICKLIKKNKIYPKKWNQPQTFEIPYKWLTYIYKKENWEYLLLTVY